MGTQAGVETALEYEHEAAQEKAEFDEKVTHAQRLSRRF
jgi:hypothetical protein